jgi:Domain of unknown function (DUF4157)
VLAHTNHVPAAAKAEKTSAQPHNEAPSAAPANPLWTQLATRVQTKLTVSAPDDPFEREADAVADRIMRMPDHSSPERVTASPAFSSETPAVQRKSGASAGGEDVRGAFESAGHPLEPSTREHFERRLGADLGDVRVHTDSGSAHAATSLHANAFTVGSDIAFAPDRYAPAAGDGRRLLAHELTHVVQQREGGLAIQADFTSDFTGKADVPAGPDVNRPAGTVKVLTAPTQTEAGHWVYAPYGIYSPTQIPDAYQDRIMESSKASDWRLGGRHPTDEEFNREMARLANRSELTVRDMSTLERGAGSAMNIRVIMAKVGNDFRFIGYDMYQVQGQMVTNGFVESEEDTTKGVGLALFADRTVRALSNGAEGMHLQVYTSQRTEDFHARIFTAVGRVGAPAEGTYYILTRREMIRIALSWSEALNSTQWFMLRELANAAEEPTAVQVQAALRASVVGSTGAKVVPSSTVVTGEVGKTAGGTGPAPGGGAAKGPPIAEQQTAAIGRLQRLMGARETIQIWRPVIDAQGEDQKRAVDKELTRLEESILDLAVRVRVSEEAGRARFAARANAAEVNSTEAAYQESLKGLNKATNSETAIGDAGFRQIEELRQRPIEQVPVLVAVGEALRTGRYSDQAFRYMLGQIDPGARDSILYGPRGGMRLRQAQFERLTEFYEFSSKVMPSGHPSMSGIQGGQLVTARVAAGALLVVEAANLGSQIYQSYKMDHETLRRKNYYPFVRRLMFWDSLGAHPAVVGVDDDFWQWSPNYERDYDTAVKELADWDSFYIEDTPERPCLSDMDVLSIGTHLSYYVRNYDEFARLFHSSGQNAVKWESPPIGGWPAAKWYVRVGEYDTDWQNTVEERWVYHEKLTQLMNVMAKRIIANTEKLLGLQAEMKALPGEESELGGFLAWGPDKHSKRARLRDNATTTTTVYTRRLKGGFEQYPLQGERIPREVTWWSPPVFIVHSYEHMGFARVSGADYNTYAVLRRTSYEVEDKVEDNRGERFVTTVAENAEAVVEIPWLLLDIKE